MGHEFAGDIVKVGKAHQDKFKPGMKFTLQPALNYKGTMWSPGYSYEFFGGDATYCIIPAEVMELGCLLEYKGRAYYEASLAEPMSCSIGAFNAAYHTKMGVYHHDMGIKKGGKLAILAGAGPMGLGALTYALHRDVRPGMVVVTDINEDRLARAESLFPPKEVKEKDGIDLHFVNTGKMENPAAELREMTGVGMMDCKKALTECDGDIDKAIEYLREKGLAASAKKAGRIAAEGMAYATVIDGVGVVVEVNAETDFVGKNEKFQNFVKGVAAVVAKEDPKDLEALMAAPYGNGRTVEQERQEMVLVIGENIKVRRFAIFTEGVSVPYIHAGGKIGVLVNLKVEGDIDATAVGKDVAMQIAALNPRFWDKSQVSQDVLDEEKKIMMAQMANDPKMASKPEQVREKIVMGKLNKFYSENCLLQQEFVRGDVFTGTVEQYIADAAKKLGGKIDFVDAVRFEKGEGIEKKQENFAEEIASMIKG